MTRTIVVAASLAQKPYQGGHAWVLLQYLLGFRRLGFDVVFLDRLERDMCRDGTGALCSVERSEQFHYLSAVMRDFGFDNNYALLCDGRVVGMSRSGLMSRVRGALLLNVMGFVGDAEILAAAGYRVFLDIDPGFGQMWQELGLHRMFVGHDRFATIGENIGDPRCTVPTCGIDWITTRQPVVLERWPVATGGGNGCFTSVGAWRGAYGPIEYRGQVYGLRVHEFRRFVGLPRATGHCFEVALNIHPKETADLSLLRDNGWRVEDPIAVASTPESYRAYVQRSMAELLIAKNMYVRSQSGWFSDRSICYLASGRPVLAQDTGLSGLYPIGEGLLTFTTLEEAAQGVEAIKRDYPRHARSARALAEACFDSDKVLGGLLEKLGLPAASPPRPRH